MEFETKRLILRPAKRSDWRDIYEGASDKAVAMGVKYLPYPYKKKDAVNFIKELIKNRKSKDNFVFFIELKSERKVIGVTSIFRDKEEKGIGITGSWINKRYWRKGYILEAKVPILDFAFNVLKFRKVESYVSVNNKASNSMSRKLGFKLEGTRRSRVTSSVTGKSYDENIYGLFKNEWKARRPYIVKEVEKKVKMYG